MLLLLQVAFVREWYFRPVTFEVILPVVLSLGQYLHECAIHVRSGLVFFGSVSSPGGWSLDLTRMSLRFFGLRRPTFSVREWRSLVLVDLSKRPHVFRTWFGKPL